MVHFGLRGGCVEVRGSHWSHRSHQHLRGGGKLFSFLMAPVLAPALLPATLNPTWLWCSFDGHDILGLWRSW